ncbi:MAG: dienelactone hydrolase family protein [Parachlamydiaceae bacterium]
MPKWPQSSVIEKKKTSFFYKMKTVDVVYCAGDTICKGFLAMDGSTASQKRPAVVIAHTWKGADAFVKDKAQELAKLGYVGFAADLFGEGRVAKDDAEAKALIAPLFVDRKMLRERIVAAYETMRNHPAVDVNRIAAIGFCFGGLTVIELLRSGVDVKAIVSFHGIFGNQLGDWQAINEPAQKMKGAALLLHGHQDPFVPQRDILAIQEEFSRANIDWQMYIYGNAAHAFTNPQAHDVESGLVYNESTANRSWQSMQIFLKEYLSLKGNI